MLSDNSHGPPECNQGWVLSVDTEIKCAAFVKQEDSDFYLLTYSMEQSPSWEANWSAASQEIPRILWNPKVHHRTHKRMPPVPILS